MFGGPMFQYFNGQGGRAIYGAPIGIISNVTVYPRVPGDAGNLSTYPFPTIIKTVPQKAPLTIIERIMKHDSELLEAYKMIIRDFENAGVRAVTTTCGFNVIHQDELSKTAKVPVFTSSLLQLPLIQKLLPEGKRIGIITANGKIFSENKNEILSCAGADPLTPIAIEGMENEDSFLKPFLDQEAVEGTVVNVAKRLMSKNPDVGAILFECHNLPPYGKAVQDATGLPVFDIITLVDFVFSAVIKTRFVGIV
jgi:hypothetical protein